MKIVFVGTGQEILQPRSGHSLAVQTVGLAQAMRERHEVHAITRTDRTQGFLKWKLNGEQKQIDGVHYHFVPSDVELQEGIAHATHEPGFARKFAARAVKQVRAIAPDAVLVWESLTAALAMSEAAPRALIVLLDAHAGLRHVEDGRAAEIARSVDRILVPARFVEREIATRHASLQPKLGVLPFGVDTDLFRVLVPKGRLGKRFDLIRGESTMLTFIGRLTPEKGAHVMLDLYQAGRSRIARQPHLFVIGPALLDASPAGDPFAAEKRDYAARQQQRAQALGEFVHWLGHEMPPPMLAGYLEASDVLVLPALAEQVTGAVVGEAMASGMPIVAYDGGIHSELIGRSPDIGALVPRGNLSALVDAVVSMIETPAETRFERGKRAREIATSELTFSTVARALEGFLAR